MAYSNLYFVILTSVVVTFCLLVTYSKVSSVSEGKLSEKVPSVKEEKRSASVDNVHHADYIARLEDCKVFTCENGREPQQRRAYIPVVGRCGHESEQVEPHVKKFKKIEPCCNARDQCFQTCGKTLIECEAAFSKCLKARGVDDVNLAQYKTIVKTPPCTAFINAQTKVCSCEAEEPGTLEEEESNVKDVKQSPKKPEEESPWETHKPKLKVVERGTEDNKQFYLMPEHEDEEEYIRNNPLPGYHEEL